MRVYYITIILLALLFILLIFSGKSKEFTNEEWEKAQDKQWKNQVKKILYKEKPTATKIIDPELFDDGFLFYTADTSIGQVGFKIPYEEGNQFGHEEPAQLLIRWLL